MNFMEKFARRREIKQILAGKVSPKNIVRIAQNNIGQSERLLTPDLGAGSFRVADKVLLPGEGIAIRKRLLKKVPIQEYVKSPDWKVLEDLQKFQQKNPKNQGFAKVYKLDKARGISYEEYVPGRNLRDLGYSWLRDSRNKFDEAKKYLSDKGVVDPQASKFVDPAAIVRGDKGIPDFAQLTPDLKITPDMARAVKSLQKKHPYVWDYAKDDNVIPQFNDMGKIKGIKAIDVQGPMYGQSFSELNRDKVQPFYDGMGYKDKRKLEKDLRYARKHEPKRYKEIIEGAAKELNMTPNQAQKQVFDRSEEFYQFQKPKTEINSQPNTASKAANLYATVYEDFRKKNLKSISNEWESLVN